MILHSLQQSVWLQLDSVGCERHPEVGAREHLWWQSMYSPFKNSLTVFRRLVVSPHSEADVGAACKGPIAAVDLHAYLLPK